MRPIARRALLSATAAAAASVAAPALSQGLSGREPPRAWGADPSGPERNVSAFTLHRPEDHFADTAAGAILCDTGARMLQYWGPDGAARIYPTSVPLSQDLTRLGLTEVVRKVDGPDWRPTPSMKERNPEWPDYWPPGPDNPLGTHALYLTWQYYRIHGTNDTRKIGRRSSNGCIGLYNEHIAELFALVSTGCQVKLI